MVFVDNRIREYQVCYYDKDLNACFYEAFYPPEDADVVMTYIQRDENACDNIRVEIFVHFIDGSIYELKLAKVK